MKCFKFCYILGICAVLSFFILYCFNFSVMSYFIPTRTRRGHSLYIREKIPNVARNEKRKKLSGSSYSNIRQIFMVKPIRSTWAQRSKARACPGSRFLHSTHHYSTQCIRRQSFFWNLLLSISCMIRVVAKEIFLFVVTSFHIMQMACKTKQ